MIKIKHTYFVDGQELEGFEFHFEPIEDSIFFSHTEVGYLLKYLTSDEAPESPREWDNFGKMVCWHGRYNLGDNHNFETPEEFEGWIKQNKKELIILPLYLLDHSGLSMSARDFSYCDPGQWDSGQVGWIYAEIGKENLSKEEIENYLLQEVKVYNMYLQGDVYCCVVETFNKDKENLDYDVVSGYFGYDDALMNLKEIGD